MQDETNWGLRLLCGSNIASTIDVKKTILFEFHNSCRGSIVISLDLVDTLPGAEGTGRGSLLSFCEALCHQRD